MRTIEARLGGTVTRIITRAIELGSQVLPEPTPTSEEIHRINQLATGIITPQDVTDHRNDLIDKATNFAYISTPAGIGTNPGFSTSLSPLGAALVNRRLEKIKAMTPEMMNQSIINSAKANLDSLRERGIIS